MEKAVVIANPAASQFTGGAHRDVMSVLDRSHTVEAVWPGSGPEASEAAARAAGEGSSLVVAMGGDGMVHHVAQGLIGTGIAMGVIPVGTTNVVSRILDIPSSPVRAARLLAGPNPPVSVGTVRLELARGTGVTIHHALFACGMGLDADVVIEADKEPYKKYRFGSVHYATTALRVALRSFPGRKPHVAVRSGDRSASVAAAVLQFREIYTYFGRLPLTVTRDRPDPMTALLVTRLRRRRIPAIAARLIARRDLEGIPEFEVWKEVSRLDLVADPPVAFQADGESLGLVDGATISWAPDSLRLVRGQASP